VRAALAALLASVSLLAAVPAAAATTMSFLDNGVVRVGVDLDRGGVITYLSRSGSGDNLVNSYDLGREIQQSYYSGPNGFSVPCPGVGTEWNPNGAGDCYGHPSTVLEHANDGTTIYVKSRPLHWGFFAIPCECTFEQWISLAGDAVRVRNRLVNARSDKTQYPARGQELPAFYTIGRLGRLLTYTGSAPYTGAPLQEITASLPYGQAFVASEHWAANVDASGFGLGVFNPRVVAFAGGFNGTRGVGGPPDDATGYISPVGIEILDWNAVYEYEYALILGTLAEIRAYAVANRPDPLPDWRFARDRQGWWYVNASDAGFPIEGALRAELDEEDPQLWGPQTFWLAKDVPKLVMRATLHAKQSTADIFWSVLGQDGFSGERRLSFELVPDGRSHAYEIDLASSPVYRGAITGIRIDPIGEAEAGAYVEVEYVTAKPVLRTLRISAAAGGSVRSTPAGIRCPGACRAGFGEASEVTLQAVPKSGYRFVRWTGACAGQGVRCVVTLERNAAAAARFARRG
jgi:hypothetical protein